MLLVRPGGSVGRGANWGGRELMVELWDQIHA